MQFRLSFILLLRPLTGLLFSFFLQVLPLLALSTEMSTKVGKNGVQNTKSEWSCKNYKKLLKPYTACNRVQIAPNRPHFSIEIMKVCFVVNRWTREGHTTIWNILTNKLTTTRNRINQINDNRDTSHCSHKCPLCCNLLLMERQIVEIERN